MLHQLPVLPAPGLIVTTGLMALIVARRVPVAAIVLASFTITALAAADNLKARWPSERDGRDVGLVGWIDGVPARDPGRTVFSFRVVEAVDANAPRRVRLSWYDPAPTLVAGQALAIEARLRSPRGLVNPGGFDYEQWLFVERYDATGYVRSGSGTDRRFGLAQWWLEVRAAVAGTLSDLIEDRDTAALIQALALGDRSGFEDRHWTVLRRTGTSHLVAVSGLHIGMIAALAFGLVLRLALHMPLVARHAHTLAATFCIVPAAVYAALAGFTLPTRRALIMLLVVQILVIGRRRRPLAGALSLALIMVLAFDPLASLAASFWLSFGAVALIVAATAPVEYPLPILWRSRMHRLGEFGRLQLALTIGLAPFVIWYFGQVSLISLLVNFIAIPVFAVIVVPASLMTALAALAGVGAAGMAQATAVVAEPVWRLLETAAQHPLAAFELPRPPLPVLLLALAAIVGGLTRHGLPGRRLALFALLPLAADHAVRPAPGLLRATVLDVGHGLAVAMQTTSHRVLYDAGPLFRSGFDAGAEIVAPALAALGSGELDMLIVSHGDSDHAGGAAAVLARYPGAQILTGPDATLSGSERCAAGRSWTFDAVRFSVLHPTATTTMTGNDSSCVVLVETRSGSLLLTGDIEARAEAALLGDERLDADVVVVPHHGSRTSSTPAFVRAVTPDIAIVSAAHNNRWGFPQPDVSRRWIDAGADMLVTGDTGAIDVVFGREGIEITPRRSVRHRYWQARP